MESPFSCPQLMHSHDISLDDIASISIPNEKINQIFSIKIVFFSVVWLPSFLSISIFYSTG